MTAEEKRQHEIDHIQRLFATLTDEYVNIIRTVGEDMQRGFAESRAGAEEGRAQLRANTEAVLRMLDRLPPSVADDEPEDA